MGKRGTRLATNEALSGATLLPLKGKASFYQKLTNVEIAKYIKYYALTLLCSIDAQDKVIVPFVPARICLYVYFYFFIEV